ncbi:hypothetical protein ACLBQC_32345, partial [Klebsiella pneumoniae]|uniref:hypothetical protein n=1 Tax=Klebsiella pneumoniae TaxID=573 RepID=UPI00396823B0
RDSKSVGPKLTNSNNELIALLSQALCKQADRIAELESRTVTVKLPEVERSIGGTGYAKAAGAQYYKECVIMALTAH